MLLSGREHEFASKNHYRLIVYGKGFELKLIMLLISKLTEGYGKKVQITTYKISNKR